MKPDVRGEMEVDFELPTTRRGKPREIGVHLAFWTESGRGWRLVDGKIWTEEEIRLSAREKREAIRMARALLPRLTWPAGERKAARLAAQGDAAGEEAGKPLCARDLGGRAEVRAPDQRTPSGLSPGVLCAPGLPLPRIRPSGAPPRLTDAQQREAAALMAVTEPAGPDAPGDEPDVATSEPTREKRCPCGLLVSCSAPESHRIGCPDLAKAQAARAAAVVGDGGTTRTCVTCAHYAGRLMIANGEPDGLCNVHGGVPVFTNAGETCGLWSPKSGGSSKEWNGGAGSSGEIGGTING